MLCTATGLGKGSLYNFFPGGKDDGRRSGRYRPVVRQGCLFAAGADGRSGKGHPRHDGRCLGLFPCWGRVCLVGWIGLGASRAAFGDRVEGYFARWIAALSQCLESGGLPAQQAAQLSEEAVSAIQGAIILSRALDDRATFTRIVNRHRDAMLEAMATAGGR
jgi:AcrR family transcriptional regulator